MAPMEDREFQQALVAEMPRLARLGHRLTPTGMDEQDLVQDVLERAWRSRSGYREDARLSTWLHTIMVNRMNDLARRSGASPVAREEVDFDVCAVAVDDPEAIQQRAADAAELRSALSTLSAEDRTVLVLCDGEDWTARETAELLGSGAEAVHKRLQRGRLKLATALAEAGADSGGGRAPESCRAARDAVSDYIDDRLEPPDRELVDRHLRECRRCPPVAQAVVGVREAMNQHPGDEVPPSLRLAVSELAETGSG
jgi:RNA polymerase sigma-70 factor (ECF subfamily)